jgi:dTMP kinase
VTGVRGAFVTLEGLEGVGKSTNVAFVADFLRATGKDVIVTREPGGTSLGEKIRHWILNEEHGALPADVETLLMFAARSLHLEQVIRPALASGRWVVCDRFTDATIAYQGGGRGADLRLIAALEGAVQRGLTPDLTLLLDAPPDVSFERITTRAPDHFEKEDREFFERVRESYLTLAAEHANRFRVVDAARPLSAVQNDIARHLDAFRTTFRADETDSRS